MENYFTKLPREFRTKKSIIVPLLVIGIALFGLISIVATVSNNFDIRNFAAPANLGNIPAGCYYVRGDCTGPETRSRVGSCKPVLICPTKTPTPAKVIIPTKVPAMINCAECLSEGSLSLCLNVGEKVSSCSAQLENTFSEFKVCVSCQDLPVPTPTSTPSPTETPQPSLTPSPTIPVITPGS